MNDASIERLIDTLGDDQRGPCGSIVDPLLQIRHLLLAQPVIGRHDLRVIGMRDTLDEYALVGVPGYNGRTILAFECQRAKIIDAQTARFLVMLGMANIAILHEEWTNLLLEKIELLLGRFVQVFSHRNRSAASDETAAKG